MSDGPFRVALRKELGLAVLEIQNRRLDHNPGVVLPEIIAGLLSLAWNISHNNANMDQITFLEACLTAAKEP